MSFRIAESSKPLFKAACCSSAIIEQAQGHEGSDTVFSHGAFKRLGVQPDGMNFSWKIITADDPAVLPFFGNEGCIRAVGHGLIHGRDDLAAGFAHEFTVVLQHTQFAELDGCKRTVITDVNVRRAFIEGIRNYLDGEILDIAFGSARTSAFAQLLEFFRFEPFSFPEPLRAA